MTKIASITLSYVAAEDRIHAAVRLQDGRLVGLWLTQRLARSLATALAGHLEKAEGIPLPTVRNAVLAQEQAAAVSQIRPSRPVALAADAPAHLVRNVELALSPGKVGLKFDSALDFRPAVVLNANLVRQWLTMLHRQFVAAGWPLDVWPAWLTEGSAPARSGATRH